MCVPGQSAGNESDYQINEAIHHGCLCKHADEDRDGHHDYNVVIKSRGGLVEYLFDIVCIWIVDGQSDQRKDEEYDIGGD